MARRTKSRRRKEKNLVIKDVPEKAIDPFAIWVRRPCNKGKKYGAFFMQEIWHKSSCKYLKFNFLVDPGDCPLFDSRFCPPSTREDE